MARRRYRRYHRRSGRWSTRLQNISGSQSVSGQNQFVIYYNLAQNPAQSPETVSQKYTVKNLNLQLQLEQPNGETNIYSVENLQAFIMFIPQGFIPTGVPSAYADVPYQHPEWILAHRFFGSVQSETTGTTPGYPALRLRSRLARKLDTGDRIVVIILGNSTTSNTTTLDYYGLVKYNTKAN